uniref:RNA helicase n=1 Tax=Blastobotrys adeninivorans TaxID=409370 RepID=A0A060T316_BLAAD
MKKAKSKTKAGVNDKARPNSKELPEDDFVMTLSDNDDLPEVETSDDEEEQVVEKKPSKKRKAEEEPDIDPDFEFSLNGFEQVTTFDGSWDFDVKESGPEKKKDVDLDSIIRSRGGLEAYEDEDQQESEDDDDLAMDGFGMGADNAQDEDEDSEEDDGDEDEDEASGDAEDGSSDDDDEEEEEKDTSEEIAKFYAPSAETDKAKGTVHKTFQTLSLERQTLKGLNALGYASPTPIQSAVIPVAMAGKDVVAGAVTGSGKTAAYLIPILDRLVNRPKSFNSTRVVVLAPTRELAIQVCDVGRKLGQFIPGLRFSLAVGGLSLREQEQELKTRPDVVIATPGRFIDHIRNSPSFAVDTVEILVVDEADRMLEEGFQKELTEILSLIPTKRQTLLFSATMNNSIKDLIKLSLRRPVRIMIDPPKQAAGGLTQEFVRIRKREQLKPAVLASLLRKLDRNQRVIVFVARKEMAHRLRIILGLLGMKIGELHGSLSQEQRLKSVTAFKDLSVPILICTDLAARGLDIPKIEVVINFDMPKTFELYLHRVGRTARAGRKGVSITFVGESSAERAIVKSALKSTDTSKGNKIVGRNVDWTEVEKINSSIDDKSDTVQEILEEEKAQKQLVQAERDIKRGENLIKYEDEIKSRPKRTWFESEKDKKSESQLKKEKEQAKKRKKVQKEKEEMGRSYKKTKKDRDENQVRRERRQPQKSKSAKSDKKAAHKMKRKGKK